MTKARIGIIGTGWWATDTHIPALLAHPQAELIAMCDSDAGRLHAAANRYEIDHRYTDVEEMLAEVALDGVIIVSANASHYDAAKAALLAGLHVMLEKPMTLFAADAKALVELSRQQGKELIIGYPFNFAPYAIRARERIAAGELGAVQYVDLIYSSYMTPLFTGRQQGNYSVHAPDQYTKPELLGGGHGQVQVTHGAGLLFFVTGLRPRRVAALMRNHNLPVDLVNAMTIHFEGDAVGTAGGSGNHKGLVFRLLVGCEEGWVDIDAQRGLGTIRRNSGESEEIWYHEKEQPHPLRYQTAHNLVDVIMGDAANGSPPETGWAAVELLDAAYRSAARDGAFVEVPQLYA
jgi:predicted dehydrogenase